jgi:hypothetical protein
MFLAVPMIAMIHFHAIRRELSSLALADHLEKFELPDSDDIQRSPLGTKRAKDKFITKAAIAPKQPFWECQLKAEIGQNTTF